MNEPFFSTNDLKKGHMALLCPIYRFPITFKCFSLSTLTNKLSDRQEISRHGKMGRCSSLNGNEEGFVVRTQKNQQHTSNVD